MKSRQLFFVKYVMASVVIAILLGFYLPVADGYDVQDIKTVGPFTYIVTGGTPCVFVGGPDVGTTVTIDGVDVEPGDVVGAFVDADLIAFPPSPGDPSMNDLCIGAFEIEIAGILASFNTWGDEAGGDKDGANTYEPVYFKIWDASAGKVLYAVVSFSSPYNNAWISGANNHIGLAATSGISADVSGVKKDDFVCEDVYGQATLGLKPSTSYPVFVVSHQSSWSDGDPIPPSVTGSAETFMTDVSGHMPAGTVLYASPANGDYDIVVDVNDNGTFDLIVDFVDDSVNVLSQPLITVNSGTGGSVSPGTGSVNCGDTPTYTFTPDTCYQIATVELDSVSIMGSVSIDPGTGVGTYTFDPVDANHELSVTFALITYTITSSAGSNGSIDPLGATIVNCGADQAFTITPAPCYLIDDVVTDSGSVLGALVGNTYTFTNVQDDDTIHATFVMAPSLTINSSVAGGVGGTISPLGDTSVDCGADQTYTMTPEDCYEIDSVSVDGLPVTPSIDGSGVGTYIFSNVTANHTIEVTYAMITYTITVSSSGDGIISPAGPDVVVNCGASQMFTMTPNPCNQIEDILVNGSPIVFTASAPVGDPEQYEFTDVRSDQTIEVIFGPIPFTITASAGTGGSISPSGDVVVNCGEDQAFVIEADACFGLVEVLVDEGLAGELVLDQLVGDTYTFENVQANHTIRAIFAPGGPSTITSSAGSNGSIDPLGDTPVECGTDQIYTITPDACYHIADVLVDDVSAIGDVSIDYQTGIGTYTFVNVQANHTIAATFAIDTFVINPFAGDHGSISPPDAVTVNCGDDQIFTMTPDPCYHIESVAVDEYPVEVTIDEFGVGTYTFENVQSMHTIEVYFAIDVFTIAASAGDNGSISPSGDVLVNCFNNQSFTITPDPCYHIDDVLVGSPGSPEPVATTVEMTSVMDQVTIDEYGVGTYTFVDVQQDYIIQAVFAIDVFTITATAGENGSISPSGEVALNCGDDQTFTIAPDNCYHILDVLVDGGSVGAVAEYTFTDVQADHTIEASFAPDIFTIAATAGANGSISPSGDVAVNCEADQTFTIAPDDCYHILDVLVDEVSVGAVAEYTFPDVRADHTIEASFAIDTFTITATAGNNGSISPSGDVGVNCGDNPVFTITPDDCYHILDVLVDEVSVGAVAEYTFTDVRADHTIEASFAIDVFTIAATAGDNGSISPSGDVALNCGDDQLFTVTPDTDYHVDDVLVDDVSVGAVTEYTFTDVRADHTIHADFERDAHTILATAGPGGNIELSGAVEVPHQTDATFTITPDECYQILDVLVDGVSVLDQMVDGTYTFISVEEAHTIEATFELETFTITASAGPGGLVSPYGAVGVSCGDGRAFTIKPNDCKVIADVLVDGVSAMGVEGGVVVDEATGIGTYTFEDVEADHTIEATFALATYDIAVTSGDNGSISPAGEGGMVTVECRKDQTFMITPAPCYRIEDVLVDGSSVGAVPMYTFQKVIADGHTIEASFVIKTYTLTASAGAGGSISPPGATTVDCGTDPAFTIAPDDCYHIVDVLVDGVSVGAVNTYTFNNVQANHTIDAVFAMTVYTIMATAGPGGSISPSGAVMVNCGLDQAFAIIPDENYHVLDVRVDGLSIGSPSAYGFQDVRANHTIHVTFELDPVVVLSATYDLLDTVLTLTFDTPVDPELCFFGIGMELEDSGNWDFALSNERGIYPDETTPSTVMTIDLNRDHATTVNLAVAVLVNHQEVDLVAIPGAFTNIYGATNREITGADNVRIQMMTHGYNLGTLGDVSGDDDVSAYDAALILQYLVKGDSALPIAGVAKDLSLWFAAYGQNIDVAEEAADVDDNGEVSAFDATLVLQKSIGLAAPALGTGAAKNGRLCVNDCDDGNLNVSIDLDDVRDVYAAEIVMTYDPQALTVTEVSKTSAVSEWMSADAAESGKLRISLAGAYQPASNGSLVTVTFDGNRDAIEQLNIAEFKLNGGRMKATIENLPKSFALLQNYPNPFNPETWIPYQLSRPTDVSITIYSTNGQMVRRLELGSMMPGHYVDRSKAAYWDGRNESGEMVSSGIYFYQLQAGVDASVRKMIILK